MSGSGLRSLTLREANFVRIASTDPDLPETEALRRAGFSESVALHPGRIVTPEMREYIADVRSRAVEATLQEAYLDAKEVLRELIRSYAGLLAQEARLSSMLGHDFADLYDEEGRLKVPSEWPEVWRRSLITEFESRLEHGRPQDGDKTAWSPIATITKVKRERVLDIERSLMQCQREKRECLSEIGRHMDVKAFPVPGEKLADGLSDLARAITGKLQGALQREARMIETTANEDHPHE